MSSENALFTNGYYDPKFDAWSYLKGEPDEKRNQILNKLPTSLSAWISKDNQWPALFSQIPHLTYLTGSKAADSTEVLF